MPPLVSVCITAYNIEKYIGECIESILRQKVNFSYEIIIGEDCSTDNTLQVCVKYQQQYPNIHVYKNAEQKGNMGNLIHTLEKCNAKYVALIDGDDLWIDDCKLQKQIDLLEAHSECALTFHDARITDDMLNDQTLFSLKFPDRDYTQPYSLEQLVKWRVIGATSSYVFRNIFKPYPHWTKPLYGPELLISYLSHQKGSIKYFPDVMSIYRVRKDGTDKSFDGLGMAERNIREYVTYRSLLYPKMSFFFFRKIFWNYSYIIFLHLKSKNFKLAVSVLKICLATILNPRKKDNYDNPPATQADAA